MSAAAASPTPRPSTCHSTAARIGFTVPQNNELVKLAEGSNLEFIPRRARKSCGVPPRRARENEVEDFLTALVRSNRAIVEAGRGRTDTPAALALPRDLGEWKDTVEFVLGPYSTRQAARRCVCGRLCPRAGARRRRVLPRGLRHFAGAAWRGPAGAIVAAGEADRLGRAAVGRYRREYVSRPRDHHHDIDRRAVERRDQFDPPLPANYREAFGALSLGHLEQIALEIPGNPFGLDNDDLIYEKATGARTAALLANVGGTPLCMVSVGGSLARELAQEGEGAMTAFALEWLDRCSVRARATRSSGWQRRAGVPIRLCAARSRRPLRAAPTRAGP